MPPFFLTIILLLTQLYQWISTPGDELNFYSFHQNYDNPCYNGEIAAHSSDLFFPSYDQINRNIIKSNHRNERWG